MPAVFGEALELIRCCKRDHGYPPLQLCDLLVVLPQLREVLLAEESTQVAEQNQNRRPAEQTPPGEEAAIDRQQVEVELDPHPDHDADA
jgi:hypothetical protein